MRVLGAFCPSELEKDWYHMEEFDDYMNHIPKKTKEYLALFPQYLEDLLPKYGLKELAEGISLGTENRFISMMPFTVYAALADVVTRGASFSGSTRIGNKKHARDMLTHYVSPGVDQKFEYRILSRSRIELNDGTFLQIVHDHTCASWTDFLERLYKDGKHKEVHIVGWEEGVMV